MTENGEKSDRIAELIRVTEEKARVEQRVADMLGGLRECDERILVILGELVSKLAELATKIEISVANSMLLAEMMGAWAADDHRSMGRIRDRIVNGFADGMEKGQPGVKVESGGVRFGDDADLDVGGDMVGRDKEE